MNRIDFMGRLGALLSDIPESERREALQYYNDYLNDAGVENEEEVLEALGTPEELAASIREGLKESGGQQGEFSETGYQGGQSRVRNEVASREQAAGQDSRNEKAAGHAGTQDGRVKGERQGAERDLNRRYRGNSSRKGMSGGMIALIVLLCILAAPIALPIILTVGIVLVVLAFVVVLLAVIFLFVGVICVVAGIYSLVGGIVDLFVFPAAALAAIGSSLMAIGIGILLTMLVGWVLARAFPKAFRAVVDFCGRIVHKKGGDRA